MNCKRYWEGNKYIDVLIKQDNLIKARYLKSNFSNFKWIIKYLTSINERKKHQNANEYLLGFDAKKNIAYRIHYSIINLSPIQ